jgi:hypothetical protein
MAQMEKLDVKQTGHEGNVTGVAVKQVSGAASMRTEAPDHAGVSR